MVSWDGVCRLQSQGACPGGARASASARFSIVARNRGERTHYAASLVSAADQQVPDDTRVVLEDLITETGCWPANFGMGNGIQLTAHAMRGWRRICLRRPR